MTRNFAVVTNYLTQAGERVYDLEPQGGELWAVAGPDGVDPATIDPDNLPEGFRWLDSDEWADVVTADQERRG